MKRLAVALVSVLFAAQVFSQTTITVVSPNGGENWLTGCPASIHWISTNTAGTVRIELFRNNVYNMTICSQVPAGMTSFTWVPPASLVPGVSFKVKVTSLTSAAAFDFSDNAFTIAAGPNPAIITLITPNGGENWIIGCPHIIQWISAAPASPVKLELFKNEVFYLTICNQVPSGQNNFTWVPPVSVIPGNTFKVKVTSLTGVGGYDFSNANFSITPGNITVGSPNGGETWVKGTMHPILWTDNICSNVRIELWKGGLFNAVIAASVPSNGSFNWVVPNIASLVPGDDYKVKVMSLPPAGNTASLVYDFSNNPFTIAAGTNIAPVAVIAPNGGENWIIGCPGLIQWVTAAVPPAPVRIELYKDGLFCMTICQQVPAGQNTFTWVPPVSIVPANNYKVKVSLLTSTAGFDFSDANFSISRGSIVVNSPNGGETWAKGTMHPILWTDNICDNVRIELWKGGLFNSVIAIGVPSSGSFNWMVPNTPNLLPGTDFKVKVISLSPAGNNTNMVFDFSDNNFSIIGNSPLTGTGQQNNITVYPNPFSSILRVDFQEASDVATVIEIMNLKGDLMLSQRAGSISENEPIELNTSALPGGKYLLVVKRENKIVSKHYILLVR